MPRWADKSLPEGRQGLLRWLTLDRPQGSAQNAVTVIFDGNPNVWGRQEETGIKVIFSKYNSADDLIKDIIEKAANKKRYVVVSDDKGIVLYVRALGAAVMGVKEFAGHGQREKAISQKRASKGVDSQEKYISLSGQEKINKEFYKIWLKKK
jgi:hypothetical protein